MDAVKTKEPSEEKPSEKQTLLTALKPVQAPTKEVRTAANRAIRAAAQAMLTEVAQVCDRPLSRHPYTGLG
eukprot:3766129-Pyramimonas_sp.AAC.1